VPPSDVLNVEVHAAVGLSLHGLPHHLAINVLHHAGDLAVPECVEMGKRGLHGTARCLEGARIHAEGSDLLTLLDVTARLGAIVDPLARQALKNIRNDRFGANVCPGIREARRFNPFGIRRERGEQANRVLARKSFVGRM
jgi:hypothetical protein